jgi:hypothetical protein
MVRSGSLLLGMGLVILWVAGLNAHAPAWIAWLDGLAALCAFALASLASGEGVRARASGGALALGFGLLALAIAGLVVRVSSLWVSWWTFAFAAAFLALGLFGSLGHIERGGVPRRA